MLGQFYRVDKLYTHQEGIEKMLQALGVTKAGLGGQIVGRYISTLGNKRSWIINKEEISQTILEISQGVSSTFPVMASKSP